MKPLKTIAQILIVAVSAVWSCTVEMEVKESRSRKPVITISTQPAETTNITVGSITGSLSVSASVTQSATLSYQWYSNMTNSNTGGTTISGATTANFPIPTTLTAGTYYYFCEVSATGGAESKRSNVATVTVNAAPVKAISSVGAQNGTLTAGVAGTVTFQVTTANIANGNYTATVSNLPAGVSVSGQVTINNNSSTLTLAGNNSTDASVTNTLRLTIDGVQSAEFTLTISQPIPVITINTQPAATINVLAGSITGSLNVGASVTQSATLSYQWYSNTTNSNTGGSEISGATSSSFTIPTTLTEGTYYYFCEVGATGGAESKRSSVATVTVSLPVIEMVSVQGGTFTMGCTAEQESVCVFYEIPAHEVTLSNFSIGKYEVTQAQWVAVMGSWPGEEPSSFLGTGDNYPVYNVSWNDIVGTSGASEVINGITYYANGFIYKLNQLTGKKYRLPTEAEWEFAARGGNQSAGYEYSGSNNIDDVAWYEGNYSPFGTKPVGTKASNELGI